MSPQRPGSAPCSCVVEWCNAGLCGCVPSAPGSAPLAPGSPAAAGESPGLFLLRKDSERRATLHRVLSDHIGPVVAHVQDALPTVTQLNTTLLTQRPARGRTTQHNLNTNQHNSINTTSTQPQPQHNMLITYSTIYRTYCNMYRTYCNMYGIYSNMNGTYSTIYRTYCNMYGTYCYSMFYIWWSMFHSC